MNLPEIAADKANHAAYGALCSVLGFAGALLWGFAAPQASLLAAGCAAAIGLAKELADALANARATGSWRSGPHAVDVLDAVWTGAGSAPLLCAVHLPGVLQP